MDQPDPTSPDAYEFWKDLTLLKDKFLAEYLEKCDYLDEKIIGANRWLGCRKETRLEPGDFWNSLNGAAFGLENTPSLDARS